MPFPFMTKALLVCGSLTLLATNACADGDNDAVSPQARRSVDVSVDFSMPSSGHQTATAAGRLAGKLLRTGQPLAGRTVWMQSTSPSVRLQTTTDANGGFSFALARGGMYLIEAVGDTKLCRVWPSHQAPPVAIRTVLLTAEDQPIVRGQGFVSYGGGCDTGCGSVMPSGVEGGFQNCDSGCGQPPRLSNCNTCSLFGSGCGDNCGGPCGCGMLGGGGRSKLLLGLLGGAVIGYALDKDDGPIEAEVGTGTDTASAS